MTKIMRDGVLVDASPEEAASFTPSAKSVRRRRLAELAAHKASRLALGVSFQAQAEGRARRFAIHPARLQTVTAIWATAKLGEGLPMGATSVPFQATDGTRVDMTESDIVGVLSPVFTGFAIAIRDYAAGVEIAELTHAAALEALTDAAAIAAYDITTGWPA